MKKQEKFGNKGPIHAVPRSLYQYSNFKTIIDIKPINKYRGFVILFGDIMGNSSQLDKLITGGRHENLDVYYNSHTYLGFWRQSVRNNSDQILLFKQTLGGVESMDKDIGGFDMKYDEFKKMCRKAWSEKFNYRCFDMT